MKNKSSESFRRFLLLGFLLSLMVLPIEADDFYIDDTEHEELFTDTLHTVEVKASQQHSANNIIPQQTISQQDLERQGITTIADALRRMTGTTIKDYGSAGGMKTVSVRGMGATHTGVILDGISVSNAESGQIDLSRFFLEDFENLSLSIGSDANLLTPTRNMSLSANLTLNSTPITPHLNGDAAVKVGSFGLIEPHLRISAPLSKTWGIQVQGHFLSAKNDYPFTLYNGIDTKTETRYHNALFSGTGMVDVRHHREDGKHEVTLKAYYYGADKELPGQVIAYNPYNEEEQDIHNAFIQATYRTFWKHGLTLEAHAKGDWNQLTYRDYGTQYTDGIKENRYEQWEGYGGTTLLWAPLTQWSFSVGADYSYQQLNSNALQACQTPYRHTLQGQVSAKFHTENWTARATLLGSDYENEAKSGTPSRDARHLSPSVSFSWHQLSWLSLRASFQDKFRMPTFSDNYYTKLGNRDLLPEKALGCNVGISFQGQFGAQHRGSWNFDIDGFYQWITDKIVAIPMNMMFWNMVNVGKVESRGIETKASLTLPLTVAGKNWEVDVDANYTLQEALNTTTPTSPYYRQQIAYTPVHSGGGSVALQMPWVSLGVNATAMGERYATNEHQDITRLDPFYEMGITLWHTFHIKHKKGTPFALTLRGDLKNLTNEQYEIIRNYPMPGRTWQINIKFNF